MLLGFKSRWITSLRCVRYRLTHLQKQAAARFNVKGLVTTVDVNGLAFDLFHDQERLPLWRATSVNQSRDVGMIQMGEDLSLAKEVAQQFRSVHATLDHLNGHMFLELIIVAASQIDSAHSAAPDLFDDPPCAEA